MSNITIVTAFFDLGRGNLPAMIRGRLLPHHQHRSVETYFEFFNNLARINNPMVIHTTKDLAERVAAIRRKHGHDDITTIITYDELLPSEEWQSTRDQIKSIMDNEQFINMVDNPHLIEYWNPEYILVNMFKSMYVQYAIDNGFVDTPLAAWIDFGYVRNLEIIPEKVIEKGWEYDFDPEKIHLFNQRSLDNINERTLNDIIKTGDVYIQGCHIVGGVEKWSDFAKVMFNNLYYVMEQGLIDDDQTFLLLTAMTNPELVELHYNSPDDWFRVFKDYNT